MKQFFICLLTVISLQSTAQDVVINFQTKEVTIPGRDNLKPGSHVKVKITNLPSSAYKVSINKTDSVINIGTPPALMNVLSFGDGFNSLLAGLSGYTTRNAGVLINTKSADGKTFKSDIIHYDGGRTSDPKAFSAGTLSEFDCSNSIRTIMPKIKSMRKTVFEFHYKFRDDIIKKADNLLYAVTLLTTNAVSFKSDAEGIINKRLQYDKELETEYQKYYDGILEEYNEVTKCVGLATADSMLAAYKKSFALFLNKFDTTFNETMIAKIYKQLNQPAASNEFISLPYKLKGDITKLNIDITGIDPAKTPQSYNTVIELERHPNRLWAFTTGVYISGLVSNEYAILTHVQPNANNPNKTDTLNYSILEEKNNKTSVGINALMNFGSYFGNSDIGGFVAFGPGLSLEKNPQFRILMGVGLMFGRNNKLALSGGGIFGSVKKLTENYKLTNTYSPAPTDITRDKFKNSWYVSLGYALFGK